MYAHNVDDLLCKIIGQFQFISFQGQWTMKYVYNKGSLAIILPIIRWGCHLAHSLVMDLDILLSPVVCKYLSYRWNWNKVKCKICNYVVPIDLFVCVKAACSGLRFFFLQTRIAIPQYFSQSYGAYFKYIVRTCTCAYTYCKCLRDVNDILRHIKIRATWLAEMQSLFAEKKSLPDCHVHADHCNASPVFFAILAATFKAN